MLFDNIGENVNYLELVELRRGLVRINRNLVRELKEIDVMFWLVRK